jgi:trigger factor
MGSWETVERPPQMGDLLSLDARGEIDGEVFWSREDGVLYLDEEGSVPVTGFPQAMVGIEPGQETEFTLPIPEDFRDASIAGKEASFTVTVKEVRERSLPELNDEFAQGLPDGYENLEALREEVRKGMAADAEARLEQEYESKVVQSLIDEATITIPPVMLENETNRIQNTQDQFLERANIRRDDYLRSIGKTEEEAQKEAEEEAEQRIRRTFALNKVSELEEIEVTDQEIDERFNEMYAGQRMRRQEQRSRREPLDDMLKYEKTVALLVEIAKSEDQPAEAQAESNQETSQDAQEGDAQDDE